MPRPLVYARGMPHDVVIIGGGHNGLTAAAYLARAGRSVLVLERDDHLGGAAVSAQAFDGVDARLSRYSYLVSLLPQRIIDDLGLDVRLVRRRFSSYTPDPADPERGLLVDHEAGPEVVAAFERVGAEADAAAWNDFYADTGRLAERLFPTLTEPLLTRSEARELVGDDRAWSDLIEQPRGRVLDERFTSDLVRGVVATDGLIGTFTDLDDPGLDANRCFLYHVIGGGTGDWNVPIGGMGAVSGELARAARDAGAELITGAEVLAVDPEGRVRYSHGGAEHTVTVGTVLANVARVVLDRLLAAGATDAVIDVPPVVRERLRRLAEPEGAQVKVNLVLIRLPRLRDTEVAPEAAFAGTFHINELASQLDAAFTTAARGGIPSPLPCEIYCHTLSDPSILSPELAASGTHTLTVFGLHVPHRLLERFGNDELRDRLQAAVLASLDSVLAEPIEDVIATDAAGRPCIETKTTLDLEEALRMPGGNIFHGPLSWPWAEDGAPLATPAERWGVGTRHPRILLCGSGAVRGGAVSGIGGHNAAMAVLEAETA